MSNRFKSGVAMAMCAAVVATTAPQESRAGVMNVVDKSIISGASSLTEQVHYRRYHHHHYYRHYYRPHRHYYRPHRHYYRRHYYRYGYDPAGAIFASAALGLMTAPLWAGWGYGGWGWGRPWGWGGWGWGGPWGW